MKRDLGSMIQQGSSLASMLSGATDFEKMIEAAKQNGGSIAFLNFGQGGQEVGLPEGLDDMDGDEMGGFPSDMDGDEMPMDAMPVDAGPVPPAPPAEPIEAAMPAEEPMEEPDSLKAAVDGALAKGGSKKAPTKKEAPKKDAKKK